MARWMQNAPSPMASEARKIRKQDRNILVVDADPAVRGMLIRVLEADGYSGWPAADGREALELAAAAPVDLVLFDPGSAGPGLLAELRRGRPELPGIAMTAALDPSVAAGASGAGAGFEKPLDFPSLLRTISKLLDEPSGMRPARAASARGHPGRPPAEIDRKPEPSP